jgi:hypothetical protein
LCSDEALHVRGHLAGDPVVGVLIYALLYCSVLGEEPAHAHDIAGRDNCVSGAVAPKDGGSSAGKFGVTGFPVSGGKSGKNDHEVDSSRGASEHL